MIFLNKNILTVLYELCVIWLLGKMHYKTFFGLKINVKILMKYLGILSAYKQIALYLPSKSGSGKHFSASPVISFSVLGRWEDQKVVF